MFKVFACATAALILGPVGGMAQTAEVGQEIFLDRCSVCHGDGGAGDGMVAALFSDTEKPKDLTQIAKKNGGVFPFDAVYQAIDGRREIRAHGYSRMPIWGEYFMEEAIADPTQNPKNARAVTEGRILAVVYYLQTIQGE